MPSESERPSLVGRIIYGYRVEERIGTGSQGDVYRITHPTLHDKHLALKILHGENAASHELRARFLQDAMAAAKVGSSGVVQPIQIDELDDGTPYIVMELAPGRSLDRELDASGPLSVRVATRIAAEVATTMTDVHRCGILHRDLKPGNVMVDRDGEVIHAVKLLDFGVARVSDDIRRVKTAKGQFFGTRFYIAPETSSGDRIDGRADVFSLGVVLYEMLTGEAPFPGLFELLSPAPAPSVAEHRPAGLDEVPPLIDRIVTAAMAKRASERLTMTGLRDELDSALELLAATDPGPRRSTLRAMGVPRREEDTDRTPLPDADAMPLPPPPERSASAASLASWPTERLARQELVLPMEQPARDESAPPTERIAPVPASRPLAVEAAPLRNARAAPARPFSVDDSLTPIVTPLPPPVMAIPEPAPSQRTGYIKALPHEPLATAPTPPGKEPWESSMDLPACAPQAKPAAHGPLLTAPLPAAPTLLTAPLSASPTLLTAPLLAAPKPFILSTPTAQSLLTDPLPSTPTLLTAPLSVAPALLTARNVSRPSTAPPHLRGSSVTTEAMSPGSGRRVGVLAIVGALVVAGAMIAGSFALRGHRPSSDSTDGKQTPAPLAGAPTPSPIAPLIDRARPPAATGAKASDGTAPMPTPPPRADFIALDPGTRAPLFDVWGDGKGALFVVGGKATILRSRDGGASFQRREMAPSRHAAPALYGVWGDGDGAIWAVGERGTIVRSTDGGDTFATNFTGAPGSVLYGIWGSARDDLYVVGNPSLILHSSDGGDHWQRQPTHDGNGLRRVWGSARGHAWAVGWGETVLHTTDGKSWSVARHGSSVTLFDVWGEGERDVYAVGSRRPPGSHPRGADDALLHTADGGRTWSFEKSAFQYPIYAIGGSGSGDFYIGGPASTVYRFGDGSDGKRIDLERAGRRKVNRIFGRAGIGVYISGMDGLLLRGDRD